MDPNEVRGIRKPIIQLLEAKSAAIVKWCWYTADETKDSGVLRNAYSKATNAIM